MERTNEPQQLQPAVPAPRIPRTSIDDAERSIDDVLVKIVEVPVRALQLCVRPLARLARKCRGR